MIIVTVDWVTLSGTVQASDAGAAPLSLFPLLRPLGLFREYEASRPNKWYRRAVRCVSTGATIYWETTRNPLDVSFVASGADCQRIGEGALEQILSVFKSAGFSATRVDVAATFVGESRLKAEFDTLPAVLAVVKAKRKVSSIRDARGYTTVTVGSRQSVYYCRMYDRPKDLYGGNADSFRVELEVKGEAAKKLFASYSLQGLKAAGLVKAASMVKVYAPLIASALNSAASGNTVLLPSVGRRGAIDPADWYRSQVGPAIMKLMRENYVKYEEVKRYLLDILA